MELWDGYNENEEKICYMGSVVLQRMSDARFM